MITTMDWLGDAQGEEWRTLADFGQSGRDPAWEVVNDVVMGGRSHGGYRLTPHSLLFSGVTNTNGGGFSSIRSGPLALDLEPYDGIRVRVRGDGRTYMLRLTTSDTQHHQRRPSHRAELETRADGTWQEIELPFSAFRPRWRGRWLDGPALDPARVDGMGLMVADGLDGPFRLEVAWIRAFRRSASQPAFRSTPTMLVFADSSYDPRLRRQLVAVRSWSELEAREIAAVVALSSGGPRADALRRRHRVAPHAFAVRFLGETGDVELYNTSRDIDESDNVASVHPELADRLTRTATRWMNEIDAPRMTPNPQFDPAFR